jgi:hypothetical protein
MIDDTFIAIYDSPYTGLTVACFTNNFVEVLASNFVNDQAAWRYANQAAVGLAIEEVVDFTGRRLSETAIKKSFVPKRLSPHNLFGSAKAITDQRQP